MRESHVKLVLAGLSFTLFILSSALRGPQPEAAGPPRRIPEYQSHQSDGCTQIHFENDPRGIFPHYVSVGSGSDIRQVYGVVEDALISHEDLPLDHDSHD